MSDEKNVELRNALGDIKVIREALESTTTSLASLMSAFGILSAVLFVYTGIGIAFAGLGLPSSIGWKDLLVKYGIRFNTVPGNQGLFYEFPAQLPIRIGVIAAAVAIWYMAVRSKSPGILAKRIFLLWIVVLSFNLLSASALSSGSSSGGGRSEIVRALMAPPVTALPGSGFYQIHFVCFSYALCLVTTGLFTKMRSFSYIGIVYAVLGLCFQMIVGMLYSDLFVFLIVANVIFVAPFPIATGNLYLRARRAKATSLA